MEWPSLSLVTTPPSEVYFDKYYYSYFSFVLTSISLIYIFSIVLPVN